MTEGTDHAGHYITLKLKIDQWSTRADLRSCGDLQQSIQAALIDL
jgi:hypothetical protein